MPQDKGTITVTDEDVVMPGGTPDISWLTQKKPPDPAWWDRASKGLISPDKFLSWATDGQFKSVDDLEKFRNRPPDLKETPGEAFSRTFHSGVTADLARTASTLTSPVALTTSAIGQAARLKNALGATARA